MSLSSMLGQGSAVTNAFMYHKDGEFLKAKEAIDGAITNEKTKMKSKTWYFRGNIYRDLAGTADGNPSMLEIAAESYSKSEELGNGDEYANNSKAAKAGLWSTSLNAAIKAHTANDLDGAMKMYEIAMAMRPADTLAYFNGTIAAEQAQNFSKVLEYNTTLLENKNTSPSTYLAISRAHVNQSANDKAIAILDKGLATNVDHKGLLNEKINIQIKGGKGEEAIESLKKSVASDPKNDAALYNLGYLYGQLNDLENAEINYKKAIEANPNNEDANYMLGNMHFNTAAELYNEINEMGFGDYQKTGAKKELVAKAKMKESIPYFEKVHSLNPGDKDTMQSLITAYDKIGRSADSEAMYKKMNP